MSGANYDILAKGLIDKSLTGTPQTTYWRSTWKRHTLFSIESVSQPFNTSTNFGQESQILLNRVGDMIYFLYVHVTLPGIVACDTKTESCPGIAAGGQFPVFMDGGAACTPCAKMDEAAIAKTVAKMPSIGQVAQHAWIFNHTITDPLYPLYHSYHPLCSFDSLYPRFDSLLIRQNIA